MTKAMNPSVETLNKMAGGVISEMEANYPALDDAQKRCILEIASKTYESKISRDTTLASLAMILGAR